MIAGAIVAVICAGVLTGQYIALLSGVSVSHQGSAVPAARTTPGRLPDPEAARLMDDLISSRIAARHALAKIVASRDSRFIAVLLEVLRAGQVGALNTVDDAAVAGALERLSGKRPGGDWPAWVEWYGGTSLVPPPGFTGWKGRLLGRIDPRFSAFLTDASPSRIRVEEIEWGGVAVDGIPALTNPRMIPAGSATYLTPDEPVFGLAINGYARAYPLRILDWHEMVNDRIGGHPVSLAYCTLCGAGIAYDGRAPDGATYTFGSSGLLYRSNKLMYDRETRTLWNQLTGEPVLGRLAATGVRLTPRPLVLTSWSEWVGQHPETKVLDLHTGYDRTYLPGAPYGQYFASQGTMFPVWRRSRALPPKARIFALRIDGVPKAFPANSVAARQVVNDVVGNTPVVLIATHGTVMVRGRHDGGSVDRTHVPAVEYNAGAEVRAFARGRERFHPGPDPTIVLDSWGRPWRITEDALIGPEGLRAARLPGFLAYWFAWYAFFPQTQVYHP
jgi:Protein of unknown function (DUF3179)